MRNKYVLHVIGQFAPIVGGRERSAQRLIDEVFDQSGLRNIVLTTRFRKTKKFENIGSAEIVRLGGSIPGPIKVFLFYVQLIFEILIRRQHILILHIHGVNKICFLAVLMARFINRPSLVKVANSGELFDFKKLSQSGLIGFFYSKFIAKKATIFIALTETIKDELVSIGVNKKNIYVIRNGINLNYKYSPRKEFKILRLISVCSLSKKKNVEFLLNVLSKTKKDIYLKICGDGPEADKLKKLAINLNFKNKIKFLGNVDGDDLENEFLESDVFVQPSIAEGMSNSLIEALSFGLAPIVTNIPANVDTLGHSLSKLSCLNLIEKEWLDKIERYHDDHRLLQKAKLMAKEASYKFEISVIAKKYINIYKSID